MVASNAHVRNIQSGSNLCLLQRIYRCARQPRLKALLNVKFYRSVGVSDTVDETIKDRRYTTSVMIVVVIVCLCPKPPSIAISTPSTLAKAHGYGQNIFGLRLPRRQY